MGPWQVRNERNPFAPGCSYTKLREMIARGKIHRETVIRGPSTRQFWTLACNAPGVAVLMGECHACHSRVDPDDYMCKRCGTVLTYQADRQHLGLAPVKLLPWEASPAEVASSGLNLAEQRPTSPGVAPGEAWIDQTGDGRTLRVGSADPLSPTIASMRTPSGEPWRTLFIVLFALVVLGALVTLVTVLTAEPAPAPGIQGAPAQSITAAPTAPLQSTDQVLSNLAGALGAVDALREQGTEESLSAAAAALKSLINQAERDGHDGAAHALRERLRAVTDQLDAIELRKILAE